MLKKGLYILVATCFICLMSGFGVHQPVKAPQGNVFTYSPFDIHPPLKIAVAKNAPSVKEKNEDAARQNKLKRRAKGKFSYVRQIELIPLISSIDLNFVTHIPSYIRQHFNRVLSGALPHYHAYLFRLTPF